MAPYKRINASDMNIRTSSLTPGRVRKWPHWLLLLPALPVGILVFLFAVASHAANYRWTDRDGTLHFSDTPPSYEVPRNSLSIEDHEQRPLMGKGLVVFQDRVFKIVLVDEQQDKLLFDVEYANVHNAYPEAVRSTLRLIVSSVDRGRTATYLAYTVAPVNGGSNKLRLMNSLTRNSPSRLETELLHISLYVDNREKKGFRILLKKEIRFRKVWEKRAGVEYQ